ncbi:MAG: archaellin/type IV pilin N-terminal domain-containing protein [Candidatus Aenigmatarchaeota archaeon]
MKGVSAVIAVILILMIVVAMAALAYTWFTSMTTDLMTSTGQSINKTTTQMAKGFSISSAGCNAGALQFAIVNTGTGVLQADQVEASLDGLDASTSNPGGTIPEGGSQVYTGGSCVGGETLRVVIESGLAMTKTVE